MTNHCLKCWTPPFQAIISGLKTFEYRKNDRDFKTGDNIVLLEWNASTGYTGKCDMVKVTWILYEGFGLPEGYCIMSIIHETNKNTLNALKDLIELWKLDAHQTMQSCENGYEYSGSDFFKGEEQAYEHVIEEITKLLEGKK